MKTWIDEVQEALQIVHERIKSWPELEPNEIGWARMQMVVEQALAAIPDEPEINRIIDWLDWAINLRSKDEYYPLGQTYYIGYMTALKDVRRDLARKFGYKLEEEGE